MNAKDSVVRMKDRLATAGFVVEVVDDREDKISFLVTTDTDNVWATKESFYLGASKFASTNRWNKYFSYTRSSIGDHKYESNITYSRIYSLINMAIFCADSVKAGK
jgi:hypothetical protein